MISTIAAPADADRFQILLSKDGSPPSTPVRQVHRSLEQYRTDFEDHFC
jgi:hypothetical protein